MWQDKNMDHKTELVNSMETIVGLIDSIFEWGQDRNITAGGGATARSQSIKLLEEVAEITEGIDLNDREKIVDGIGDSLVVLIQVARLAGVSFDEALKKSWKDIKDRKGEMKCGVFVKEADLKLIMSNHDAHQAYVEATTPEQVKYVIDMAKQDAQK